MNPADALLLWNAALSVHDGYEPAEPLSLLHQPQELRHVGLEQPALLRREQVVLDLTPMSGQRSEMKEGDHPPVHAGRHDLRLLAPGHPRGPDAGLQLQPRPVLSWKATITPF